MDESRRTTGLRALLLSAVGVFALLGGVAAASALSLPFGARLVIALAGFVGYVLLLGTALDERFRLDRRWRHEPPSRGSWGGTRPPRGSGDGDVPPAPLLCAVAVAGVVAFSPAASAAEIEGTEEPATAPAPAAEAEKPGFLSGVKLSGFVDVYASYNANRPASRDSFLPGTGSTAKKANQLGLNLVEVEAVRDPEPLGFRVALNWGTATDVIHAGEPTGTGVGPEVWKVVQYASISWKVPGSEVLLEGGIFPSHVGAEAYFSKDNPHYTRSFVAEYTPWYQAGIKATAPLGKGFTGQLHLLNGWQVVGDNNDGKTIGAGLGWSSGNVDVGLNGLAGPELPDDTSHWRTFGDLVATWRATPTLTVTGEFDAGSQSRPGLDPATWWGAFVSARAALGEKSAVALRAERFSDPEAGISGFEQKIWGVTATFEHRPVPRLILKLDVRYDESTAPLFDGPVEGEGRESQFLAVVGAVATF